MASRCRTSVSRASGTPQRLQARQWGHLSAWQKSRVLALLGKHRLGEGKWEEAGTILVQAKAHQPDDENARTNEAVGYEVLLDRERAFALAVACGAVCSGSSLEPKQISESAVTSRTSAFSIFCAYV